MEKPPSFMVGGFLCVSLDFPGPVWCGEGRRNTLCKN
nr:MAG TPA: hypothetical protein [Caudoviricetes sp.]